MWYQDFKDADHTEVFCKPQFRFVVDGPLSHRSAVYDVFRTGSAKTIQQDGLDWARMWAINGSILMLARLLTVRTEWSRK